MLTRRSGSPVPATLPSPVPLPTRPGRTSRTGRKSSPDQSTRTRKTSFSTWAMRLGMLSLGEAPFLLTLLVFLISWVLISSSSRVCLTRLIASDKGGRISDLVELQSQPFFSSLPFGTLREIQAPFVPALESEIDVGYYDDFTNQEDLAKYGPSTLSFLFSHLCFLVASSDPSLYCCSCFFIPRISQLTHPPTPSHFLWYRRGLRETTQR
jgi:hypothetical protein